MSQPIDELLISIGIEEGSNLAELYTMLQEIQSGGGNIQVDLSGLPSRQQVTGIGTRIDNLVNTITAQLQTSPEIAPALLESIVSLAESMAQSVETIRNLEHAILTDFSRIESSANILSNSLGWLETQSRGATEFYGMGVEMLKVVNKVFEFLKKNLGEEGFAEKMIEKLEELKDQCVHKEVLDLIWNLQKLDNKIPKVRGHMTSETDRVIKEVTGILFQVKNDTELLREKFDVMKARSPALDMTPFTDEITSLSNNLIDLLDGVLLDWANKASTKEIDIAEKVREVGVIYNTLLHHYLRQEIKIDRFTNLLGKKIVKEAEEFSNVMDELDKYDKSHENIIEKAEAIQTHLDNIEEQIADFRRTNEVLQSIIAHGPTVETMGRTGFDAVMELIKIMIKSPNVTKATEGMIASSVVRAGLRNIESIPQKMALTKSLDLSTKMAAQVEDIMNKISEELFTRFYKEEDTQVESIDDIKNQQNEDSEKLDKIIKFVASTDDKLDEKSPAQRSDGRDEKGQFAKKIRIDE